MASRIESARILLQRDITENRYPIDSILPPIPKLASKASCSQATMRRAIRSLAQAGILKPVKKLGTMVLRRPPLGRIALLLSAEPHTNLILQDALCRQLAADGFDCDLIPHLEDPQLAEVWRQRLASPGMRPDCVVVIRPVGVSPIRAALSSLCPAQVCFDSEWCSASVTGGAHVVAVDHRQAARLVAEHLLGLGHRRVAAFAEHVREAEGSLALEASRQLRDLMEVAGGSCHLHYGVDGFDGLLRLIRDQGVTAFWDLNDATAVTTLTALSRAGLEVPGDLSLIGRNDTPWSRQSVPAITTVSWNPEAVARTIAAAIRGRLAGDLRERVEFVPPLLLARESCSQSLQMQKVPV